MLDETDVEEAGKGMRAYWSHIGMFAGDCGMIVRLGRPVF
jgi:hypothetical protein